MKRDIDIIMDAIYYLLTRFTRSEKVDKLKIVKLIYLADKYHLLSYGRTITNDLFCVLEHGPIGSSVLDALTPDTDYLDSAVKTRISEIIDRSDKYDIKIKNTNYIIKALSESDRGAIDFIFEKFHTLTAPQLREYVHKYPEYLNNEAYINKGMGRVDLETQDVFGVFPGDIVSKDIPKEHIDISRELSLGAIA
jgi:uncharacterized phage-associated protein